MRLICKAFQVPKTSDDPRDCEDVFWPRSLCDEVEFTDKLVRLAVADGASTAIFSRNWAALLAQAYCEGNISRATVSNQLSIMSVEWQAQVTPASMPWYLEEKIQIGSFATLLGLTLRQSNTGSLKEGNWRAIAIGDSCLFQVRGRKLIKELPRLSPEKFQQNPVLAASNPVRNVQLTEFLRTERGTCLVNDKIYLMTDALAFWFVSSRQRGEEPWTVLDNFETKEQVESFPDWVTGLRKANAMPNDDVTLVRVDIA